LPDESNAMPCGLEMLVKLPAIVRIGAAFPEAEGEYTVTLFVA
jgi:hypothetical protein